MAGEANRLLFLIRGITLAIALIIILDIAIPGERFTEDVLTPDVQTEEYHNAGGNSHKSYFVTTANHQFYISEEFAQSLNTEKVSYSVSFLFREINNYGLASSSKKFTYSLRVVSGLIIPLLLLLMYSIMHISKKPLSIVISVFQLLLLADLIFLIL